MINEAKYAARRTAEKGNPTDGRISRRNQEAIKKFRLMDDDFMRMVLEGDKEAAEEIVRTILAREDIHILEVTAQREYIGTAAGSRTIIIKCFQHCWRKERDILRNRREAGQA